MSPLDFESIFFKLHQITHHFKQTTSNLWIFHLNAMQIGTNFSIFYIFTSDFGEMCSKICEKLLKKCQLIVQKRKFYGAFSHSIFKQPNALCWPIKQAIEIEFSIFYLSACVFFLSYTVTLNFIFCFRWLSMVQTEKKSQLRFSFHDFGIRQSKKEERHRI